MTQYAKGDSMKNYPLYKCTKFNNFKELIDKAADLEDKAAIIQANTQNSDQRNGI